MTIVEEAVEGFKMTELGLMPEDWEVRAIKDVAEIKYGKANPHTQGQVPLVGSSGIFGWVEKPLIEEPTIIVGRKGTAGSIHLFLIPSYPTDTTFFLVFNNEKPNLKFLYYWMSLNKLSGEHAKTTLPSLQKADLENYEFAYPLLPEQQKIASVLSAVQEAKEKTENVIRATRELKKAMMKHLFTYGPVPVEEVEKVPLKETEIGLIPEHWEVVKLGEVVKKTKQTNPENTPKWKFKYISGISREILTISEYKLFLGKDAPSRARKLIETGDVIFATVRPTLKRLALIDECFNGQICSTAFCVLRANEKGTIPRYIYYIVSRDFFIEELGKVQRGASYPAVTDSDVKNQKIPLPPLPE
ncbi:MAG: restriction endonuclease subunit S [Nitrospirota bacterium]